MVIDKINQILEERRQKKAGKIVERGMLDSYRESESMRKAEQIKKEADRLVHLKQYKAAIEEYQKALEQYPLKREDKLFETSKQFLFILHYNMATTYSLLKSFIKSLEFFDKSLSIGELEDEMKTKALSAKGTCFYRAKKFLSQVQEQHSTSITLESNFEKQEKIRDEVKKLDEKEDLLKRAHSCFTQATEIERNNPDLWYHKGHMEFLLGMIKESISSFDTVINIRENYENKEGIDLFDEIKKEKGIEILEKQDRVHKTKTGHYVKNKAEKIIADFLFHNNLLFQYNLSLAWSDLDIYANFYIPQLEVYIDHFKRDQDSNDLKLEEYKKSNKRHIHTVSDDEMNLEETLRLKLKPFIDL